jgi:hypothetical protein
MPAQIWLTGDRFRRASARPRAAATLPHSLQNSTSAHAMQWSRSNSRSGMRKQATAQRQRSGTPPRRNDSGARSGGRKQRRRSRDWARLFPRLQLKAPRKQMRPRRMPRRVPRKSRRQAPRNSYHRSRKQILKFPRISERASPHSLQLRRLHKANSKTKSDEEAGAADEDDEVRGALQAPGLRAPPRPVPLNHRGTNPHRQSCSRCCRRSPGPCPRIPSQGSARAKEWRRALSQR